MKKIALALTLLAFTGSSALEGSILVNTVSFADLPDKTDKATGKDKSKKDQKTTKAASCTITVSNCSAKASTVSLAGSSCPTKKASVAAVNTTTTPTKAASVY